MIKYIKKSEFVRNVATLFTGTALAQIIPIMITPVLTRIYDPKDYGVLAVFAAFVSLSSIVSTLRYDTAILLPADDKNAMALTILCGLCVLGHSIVLLFLIFLFHGILLQVFKSPALATLVYLVPLSVIIIGWNNAINYWLNRKKQYRKLAINRIIIALAVAMGSLVFGFAGFGYSGLIFSTIISQFIALFILLSWAWDDLRIGLRRANRGELLRNAISYRKFPLFALPSDAANALSQQIPIFMLNSFGPTVVGHFSFSQKILGMPLTLMSQSISDVFKQRASADYNSLGNCKHIFSKTTKALSSLSVVPLVIVFLFSPIVFKVIFGEAWEVAGHYTRYLAPLYIFRFIVSPLTYVLYIANRQDADLVGQIGLLLVSLGSMIFGIYIRNADAAIITFSGGYILVYCFYYWGARNLSYGRSFL